MLWSDSEIKTYGPDILEPYDESMVQPSSIDLTLDKDFFLFKDVRQGTARSLSIDNSQFFEGYTVPRDTELWLAPGAFALASTYEKVKMPGNVAARFEGKSSLGRMGLFTHITAGFIDPGFEGHITLELYNALPMYVGLTPGMKIGQLCFMYMCKSADHEYGSNGTGSHYQGQRGPTRSRMHENFTVKDVYGGEV